MATVTLKGMTDILHRRLKSRARGHRRSLNREILSCLEEAVTPQRVDPETWLRRAADARSRVHGRVSDAELKAWRDAGRP